MALNNPNAPGSKVAQSQTFYSHSECLWLHEIFHSSNTNFKLHNGGNHAFSGFPLPDLSPFFPDVPLLLTFDVLTFLVPCNDEGGCLSIWWERQHLQHYEMLGSWS